MRETTQEATQYERRAALPPHAWKGWGLRAACMMNLIDETLEWRSVLDALRNVYVDKARATLGTKGVVAFTDGACIKNPGGPAGWSAILLAADDVTDSDAHEDAEPIECFGYIPKSPTTTNNRAEITAVLAVLCIAPPAFSLKIYSDSEYTIKVAQGTYQMKANADLWALYRMLLNRRKVPPVFEWVRGHAGHDLNERADELAGLGAWNGDRDAYRKWQESSALAVCRRDADAALRSVMVDCMHEKNIQNRGL